MSNFAQQAKFRALYIPVEQNEEYNYEDQMIYCKKNIG